MKLFTPFTILKKDTCSREISQTRKEFKPTWIASFALFDRLKLCVIWVDSKGFTWQRLQIFASTCVLLWINDSNLFPLCRFSCIWLEFSGSRTHWIKAMSPNRTQKVLPQKRNIPAEEWEHLEEDTLKQACSASVCMTCQHFNYYCDRNCRTILTCHLHQRLIPHGDHLTSKCRFWMQRLERKIGWCPEAA